MLCVRWGPVNHTLFIPQKLAKAASVGRPETGDSTSSYKSSQSRLMPFIVQYSGDHHTYSSDVGIACNAHMPAPLCFWQLQGP